MVRASVLGAISYKDYDGSNRWWRKLAAITDAIGDDVHLKVLELVAIKAAALQGMEGLDMSPSDKQQYALEAIERFEARAMPWLKLPTKQTGGGGTIEDKLAQWVAVFGHDTKLLESLVGKPKTDG